MASRPRAGARPRSCALSHVPRASSAPADAPMWLPDRATLGPSLDALAAGAAAPRATLTPATAAAVDFLRSLGTPDVVHTSGGAFSDHLVGLYDVCRFWRLPDAYCLAAICHSIYGTMGFQGYKLPVEQRQRVVDLVGADAERIAYIFCGLDRFSQDEGIAAGDRTTAPWRPRAGAPGGAAAWHAAVAEANAVDPDFWRHFTAMTLADWLQQVEDAAAVPSDYFGWGVGQAWGYRRTAYAKMAAMLSGDAAAMHAAVMAREPKDGPSAGYEWTGWGEGEAPVGV